MDKEKSVDELIKRFGLDPYTSAETMRAKLAALRKAMDDALRTCST